MPIPVTNATIEYNTQLIIKKIEELKRILTGIEDDIEMIQEDIAEINDDESKPTDE